MSIIFEFDPEINEELSNYEASPYGRFLTVFEHEVNLLESPKKSRNFNKMGDEIMEPTVKILNTFNKSKRFKIDEEDLNDLS